MIRQEIELDDNDEIKIIRSYRDGQEIIDSSSGPKVKIFLTRKVPKRHQTKDDYCIAVPKKKIKETCLREDTFLLQTIGTNYKTYLEVPASFVGDLPELKRKENKILCYEVAGRIIENVDVYDCVKLMLRIKVERNFLQNWLNSREQTLEELYEAVFPERIFLNEVSFIEKVGNDRITVVEIPGRNYVIDGKAYAPFLEKCPHLVRNLLLATSLTPTGDDLKEQLTILLSSQLPFVDNAFYDNLTIPGTSKIPVSLPTKKKQKTHKLIEKTTACFMLIRSAYIVEGLVNFTLALIKNG